MPMLHVCRNYNHRSRRQTDRRFAGFLIPAFACGTDKHLAAAGFSVMNVPVIAATRLEGYVGEEKSVFRLRQRIQIGISDKITSIRSVFSADTEDVLLLEHGFVWNFHIGTLLLFWFFSGRHVRRLRRIPLRSSASGHSQKALPLSHGRSAPALRIPLAQCRNRTFSVRLRRKPAANLPVR